MPRNEKRRPSNLQMLWMQPYEHSFHIYSTLDDRKFKIDKKFQLNNYKTKQDTHAQSMLTQRPNIWLWTIRYISKKLRTHIAWSSHNLSHEAKIVRTDNHKILQITISMSGSHYLQRKQDRLMSTSSQVQNHLPH